MRWLPLTVVFGVLLAQGVIYPQDKPAAAREKMPAPNISMATAGMAWSDDLWRVSNLGLEQVRMQFMRSYERVDFATWDRIVSLHQVEMDAYFKKWDTLGNKGSGPVFRDLVRQRIEYKLPEIREDFGVHPVRYLISRKTQGRS